MIPEGNPTALCSARLRLGFYTVPADPRGPALWFRNSDATENPKLATNAFGSQVAAGRPAPKVQELRCHRESQTSHQRIWAWRFRKVRGVGTAHGTDHQLPTDPPTSYLTSPVRKSRVSECPPQSKTRHQRIWATYLSRGTREVPPVARSPQKGESRRGAELQGPARTDGNRGDKSKAHRLNLSGS